MSKAKADKAKSTEAQLLKLLKQVLPKATHDPKLAAQIYAAIEGEFKSKARASAFHTLCTKLPLTDLEAGTIEEVKQQLALSFGDGDVTLQPNRKEKTLTVEVSLPDGTQFTSEIKVNPNAKADAAAAEGEEEVPLKYVPFPVSLPGDPELVWALARTENLTADEGCIALSKAEDDFWASKAGQKLLKDRVERSFPEFIARVPAGFLKELGLKRHYKAPEPIKQHHTLAKRK